MERRDQIRIRDSTCAMIRARILVVRLGLGLPHLPNPVMNSSSFRPSEARAGIQAAFGDNDCISREEGLIPAFAGMTDSIKFGLRSTLRHSGQVKREPESRSLWPQRPAFHAETCIPARPRIRPGTFFRGNGGTTRAKADPLTLVHSWSVKRPPGGNRRDTTENSRSSSDRILPDRLVTKRYSGHPK